MPQITALKLLENLVSQPTIHIDEAMVANYLKARSALVTGAAGSIGSELSRHIATFSPSSLILFDHNENDAYFLSVELKTRFPRLYIKTIIGDIKDVGLLRHTFSRYRPNLIFHSAAYKHVPLMEANPVVAVKNNIIGTRNLVDLAWEHEVERFVFLSTDKAVNPNSVMGASKRIAEVLLETRQKGSKTKFISVRFGNVIGSNGSVVPLFKRQIEEGGPITVTHPEAKRYFMTLKEAVKFVLAAGAIGEGGEVFMLDMGQEIKILDLAKNLVTLSGLKIDKDITLEFIGLRPGERLSEDVVIELEGSKKTGHAKIYIVQASEVDSVKFHQDVEELEKLAEAMEEDRLMKKLKEMIQAFA